MFILLCRRSGYLLNEEIRVAAVALLLLCMYGCTGPQLQARPDKVAVAAALRDDAMVMPDGYRLPFRRWLPAEQPRALVLALHGFNDYSNAFASTASYLSQQAIAIH